MITLYLDEGQVALVSTQIRRAMSAYRNQPGGQYQEPLDALSDFLVALDDEVDASPSTDS